MKLLLSDFNNLPGTLYDKINGINSFNSPLVQIKGEKSDEFQEFTINEFPKGKCDIFFGTNFNLIKRIVEQIT